MKSVLNVANEFRLWFCNFVIAFIPFHFIRLSYYKYVMNFKIGKGSSIHLGCHFNTPGLFEMKENSTINQFCHVDNRGGVTIGNNVSISPKVSMVTVDHDVNHEDALARVGPIMIEDFVFIGYGAIILKNSTLKTGTVLGSGSLLTGSTEPYGIYFGVPAKFKKIRNSNLRYTGSYKRLFH